jgi:lipopolysaccharide transport system ATP-binding protein
MAEPIIKVENLGKRFVISHEDRERQRSLGSYISHALSFKSKGAETREEFWALRDINFEIRQGDRVGIIGRNGAGKSTLLKILSRITEPTNGRIAINGRVASLLEVGTGFHQELTGRENVFLNGAILGMSRAEIRKKFDEIVAFAEVEKFLDTPVKRYSSGMYVRLAFAVAAHLEPEILIVDEVLAVGDAQFQKKCLGKMEDVSKKEGRTILFVSHNINLIKTLCSTGILLAEGRIVEYGAMSGVVNSYLNATSHQRYQRKFGGKEFQISHVMINSVKRPSIRLFTPLIFDLHYEASNFSGDCDFFILIYNIEGACVQGIFQSDQNSRHEVHEKKGELRVTISNNLVPGTYFVSVGAFDNYKNFLDWIEYCEEFEVEPLFEDDRFFRERLGLTMGVGAIWQ